MKLPLFTLVITSVALLLSTAPARGQQIDATLLNISSQGGQVLTISASSRHQDIDDPTEAIGNPTGPIEPGTFLFADNGNGGEESLSLNLGLSGVTLHGLRITGGGAGAGAGDPRTISSVQVFGSFGLAPTHPLGQIADFNDAAGFHDIIFNVPETVDQLIIQFGTPEQGARIAEIDAIVPEPTSLTMLALGVMVLQRRSR